MMRTHCLGAVLATVVFAGMTSAQSRELVYEYFAGPKNAFGCDLYCALAPGEGNFIFSPYSISTALEMLRVGAEGDTADQMDSVLHLNGIEFAKYHPYLKKALQPGFVREGSGREARKVPAHELVEANALWAQEGLAICEPFASTLSTCYGAALRQIDFRNTAQARARINTWVEEVTRGKIEGLLREGLPARDTLLALVNALYFKAQWERPFYSSLTRKAPFTTASGKVVKVEMMSAPTGYRVCEYGTTEKAQILELQYRGGQYSMLILLPRRVDGLASLEAKLSSGMFKDLRTPGNGGSFSVKIPKFGFTSAFDLKKALQVLGMIDAFERGKANFAGMITESRPFLELALHKCLISVDENGTEAAASTGAWLARGGTTREPPEFVVDRPFLFAIWHRRTGCVLFLGRVVDPTRS